MTLFASLRQLAPLPKRIAQCVLLGGAAEGRIERVEQLLGGGSHLAQGLKLGGRAVRHAVTVAALGACAVPMTIRPEPRFTPAEVSEIQRAVDQWNAFPGLRRRLSIRPDGAWDWRKEGHPSGYNGYCDRRVRKVWIHPDSAQRGSSVYAVALHEGGHQLGLGHVEHGVMDPLHVTVTFSDEDRRECVRAGACE